MDDSNLFTVVWIRSQGALMDAIACLPPPAQEMTFARPITVNRCPYTVAC